MTPRETGESGIFARYQNFVLKNADIIGNVENTLRSLSYLIPGRFKDSDMVAEILYALLNLFRLYNDSIVSKVQCGNAPLRPSIWNQYLEYIKGQSPLARLLVTWLNVLRIIEVPTEMIIAKVLGFSARNQFIILVELQKALMKTFLWVLSGFRKTSVTLMPTSNRSVDPAKNEEMIMLDNVNLLSKTISADRKQYLTEYLKTSRTDSLILMPQFSFSKCSTSAEKMRELAHILRPLVYASLYIYGKGSGRTRWVAWGLSLSMELFSSYPSIIQMLRSKSNEKAEIFFLEEDENKSRILRLALFLLREPFYSSFTKSRLDNFKETLGEWRIMQPAVQTANTYQKLCELVHFYTSSS